MLAGLERVIQHFPVAAAAWESAAEVRRVAHGCCRYEKEQRQPCAVRTTSSMNNASMPDLRKVTIASVGVQTIGSLSLKDVLMTIGTPVCAWKQDISS